MCIFSITQNPFPELRTLCLDLPWPIPSVMPTLWGFSSCLLAPCLPLPIHISIDHVWFYVVIPSISPNLMVIHVFLYALFFTLTENLHFEHLHCPKNASLIITFRPSPQSHVVHLTFALTGTATQKPTREILSIFSKVLSLSSAEHVEYVLGS